MNKAGHVAFGLAAGSVYLWLTNGPVAFSELGAVALSVGAIAIGSLAPDIDHKTSTASKLITPFSAKKRRILRAGATSTFLIGVFLFLLHVWGGQALPAFIPEKVVMSFPLWLGAGVLLYSLAILRDLILIGVGAGLLYSFALYDLHWFTAFLGGALLVLPLVRHRGIIHTPEFGICLSIGMASIVGDSPWYAQAIAHGFIIGWFAHLAGDLFGNEGIESVFARFIPRLRRVLKVSFRMFSNGGQGERRMIWFSWSVCALVWGAMILDVSPQQIFNFA